MHVCRKKMRKISILLLLPLILLLLLPSSPSPSSLVLLSLSSLNSYRNDVPFSYLWQWKTRKKRKRNRHSFLTCSSKSPTRKRISFNVPPQKRNEMKEREERNNERVFWETARVNSISGIAGLVGRAFAMNWHSKVTSSFAHPSISSSMTVVPRSPYRREIFFERFSRKISHLIVHASHAWHLTRGWSLQFFFFLRPRQSCGALRVHATTCTHIYIRACGCIDTGFIAFQTWTHLSGEGAGGDFQQVRRRFRQVLRWTFGDLFFPIYSWIVFLFLVFIV